MMTGHITVQEFSHSKTYQDACFKLQFMDIIVISTSKQPAVMYCRK